MGRVAKVANATCKASVIMHIDSHLLGSLHVADPRKRKD